MSFSVPIIPFVLGALINMGLGALWYSNVLFAKVWMQEAGITTEEIEGSQDEMGKVYGLTMLTAVFTSYVLGFLMVNLLLVSISEAVVFAIILWIGSHTPTIIKRWGFEGDSLKLGLINHGYDLTVYVIVCTLYAFFI